MPTLIVMPQMGESIAEGTIVRWLKKVGDRVDRDEPLFEITTDKVEAEIPSPAAGILTAIMAREGETVSVHAVVGTIQQAGEESKSEQPPTAGPTAAAPAATSTVSAAREAAPGPSSPAGPRDPQRQQRSSPLVRRIAREHSVDISGLQGSGLGGRVTKQDIFAHLDKGRGARAAELARASAPASAGPRVHQAPGDRVEPLSAMRKKIAERMVLSRRTAAHVHTVFHVDFSAIESLRRAKKGDYERLGARLTYMAFIAKAVTGALRQHPIVNASLDGDRVIYHEGVNLGIAVALETGLIVPVVKGADGKSLLDLSRAIADVAERARAKQLKPDDVHGGTFTITNPGQSGAQFGMPIINQPQSAILGVGTIEKRPVVVGDGITVRTMAYLTLGYDHRLIDGAVADQFMAVVKQHLEQFDSSEV